MLFYSTVYCLVTLFILVDFFLNNKNNGIKIVFNVSLKSADGFIQQRVRSRA